MSIPPALTLLMFYLFHKERFKKQSFIDFTEKLGLAFGKADVPETTVDV